jgi:hypothetical protein
VLFDEFQQEGGYAIVAEKLILIGKLGTKEERVKLASGVMVSDRLSVGILHIQCVPSTLCGCREQQCCLQCQES